MSRPAKKPQPSAWDRYVAAWRALMVAAATGPEGLDERPGRQALRRALQAETVARWKEWAG